MSLIPHDASGVQSVDPAPTPSWVNMTSDPGPHPQPAPLPPPELVIIDALGNRVVAVPPNEDDEPGGDEPLIRVSPPAPTK